MWPDRSTAYRYLHEGIEVLAARVPSLSNVLLAAWIAGHTHLNIDGTVIRTGCPRPGRRPGWTCGGRANTSTTAATSRSSPHPTGDPCGPPQSGPAASTTPRAPAPSEGLLDELAAWATDGRKVLADLGYLGEAERLSVPTPTPKGATCPRTPSAPTCSTRASTPSPSAATPILGTTRPPAGSRCPPNTSAPSPQRPSSCCTPSRTAPPDLVRPHSQTTSVERLGEGRRRFPRRVELRGTERGVCFSISRLHVVATSGRALVDQALGSIRSSSACSSTCR